MSNLTEKLQVTFACLCPSLRQKIGEAAHATEAQRPIKRPMLTSFPETDSSSACIAQAPCLE
eukprot:CAMPEP_0172690970 /NCGR_PEP_ID=MMETSP1074-20121228/24239_1 /TAXON_ID=2916 /ORGANISM="Ceratium fusus, Strain PA161109" /LENGTH=61 /DNA_ID=CAMNT_0013510977 /DNA_START=511 /DNA_END=693 /DNA_ORIENTATION=-